eukprot:scaffold15573_cov18-Tisochrysis_lutea.AAC.1
MGCSAGVRSILRAPRPLGYDSADRAFERGLRVLAARIRDVGHFEHALAVLAAHRLGDAVHQPSENL